jgi:dienelactone hydrolase
MRFFKFLATFASPLLLLCAEGSHAQTGPTVREVVEFRRILQPASPGVDEFRRQLSPDGARAFIVTRKADVASDRNRYEIQLLHLAPDRLAERRVPAPEVVFSADVSEDGNAALPAVDDVRWWDDRSLVFMARLNDGLYQVYRLDLPKRELTQLTRETNPIVSFAASRDMRRLVYAVQVPNPPFKDGARSLVVGNQSFWSVKFGQQQISAQLRKYRYFVADVGSTLPPRPLGEPFGEGNGAVPNVDISPDGRWALLPRYEPERTLAWAGRYPLLADVISRYGSGRSRDPLGYFSSANNFKARRMVAWQLDEGKEQSILDAPDDALPSGGQDRPDRLWQGGGTSVVLAGTHLPVAASGKQPLASHVIEYWPDAKRWEVIARLAGRLGKILALSDGFALTDGNRRRQFQRVVGGGWREIAGGPAPSVDGQGGWAFQVAEGLNEPPDVTAVANGQVVRLTTLNPQFDANTWGDMKPYAWRDAQGRTWNGGLMTPGNPGRRGRMPLVIQTYGFSPNRFYLDGPNRAIGATSAFAGRAFAREGVLVLALPLRPVGEKFTDDQRKLRMFNEGVRSAIASLVKAGRVDPKRVGIIGWSSTGEAVLNLLTFSKLQIRAATIADGDENSLFSYTVTYGFMDVTWQHKEGINQGVPYGAELQKWISNDPALHTDCVRSALRIESYGQSVKNNWDLYALLRRQYKPVEMIAMPAGGHALMTPSERMTSLQGNVDWYRFWLKGERRNAPAFPQEADAALRVQYDAWQQMEALKAADDARPRCNVPATWR